MIFDVLIIKIGCVYMSGPKQKLTSTDSDSYRYRLMSTFFDKLQAVDIGTDIGTDIGPLTVASGTDIGR